MKSDSDEPIDHTPVVPARLNRVRSPVNSNEAFDFESDASLIKGSAAEPQTAVPTIPTRPTKTGQSPVQADTPVVPRRPADKGVVTDSQATNRGPLVESEEDQIKTISSTSPEQASTITDIPEASNPDLIQPINNAVMVDVPSPSDERVEEIIDEVDHGELPPTLEDEDESSEEVISKDDTKVRLVHSLDIHPPAVPQRPDIPERSERVVIGDLPVVETSKDVPDASNDEVEEIIERVDEQRDLEDVSESRDERDGNSATSTKSALNVPSQSQTPTIPRRPQTESADDVSSNNAGDESEVSRNSTGQIGEQITEHENNSIDEPAAPELKQETKSDSTLDDFANVMTTKVDTEAITSASSEVEGVKGDSTDGAGKTGTINTTAESVTSPEIPKRPAVPDHPSHRSPEEKPDEKSESDLSQSAKSSDSSDSPTVPVRPSKPSVPARPARSAKIQAFLDKQNQEAEPPKPKVKPPVASKVGALRASLFKDLDSMIARGPPPPGSRPGMKKILSPESENELGKDQTVEKNDQSSTEVTQQPTSDSRRGRVKGPSRRLPAVAKSEWSTVSGDVWEYVSADKEELKEGKDSEDIPSEDVESTIPVEPEQLEQHEGLRSIADESYVEEETTVKYPQSELGDLEYKPELQESEESIQPVLQQSKEDQSELERTDCRKSEQIYEEAPSPNFQQPTQSPERNIDSHPLAESETDSELHSEQVTEGFNTAADKH
jgi:Altered inheritance of mitochondria protein 21